MASKFQVIMFQVLKDKRFPICIRTKLTRNYISEYLRTEIIVLGESDFRQCIVWHAVNDTVLWVYNYINLQIAYVWYIENSTISEKMGSWSIVTSHVSNPKSGNSIFILSKISVGRFLLLLGSSSAASKLRYNIVIL